MGLPFCAMVGIINDAHVGKMGTIIGIGSVSTWLVEAVYPSTFVQLAIFIVFPSTM